MFPPLVKTKVLTLLILETEYSEFGVNAITTAALGQGISSYGIASTG